MVKLQDFKQILQYSQRACSEMDGSNHIEGEKAREGVEWNGVGSWWRQRSRNGGVKK